MKKEAEKTQLEIEEETASDCVVERTILANLLAALEKGDRNEELLRQTVEKILATEAKK